MGVVKRFFKTRYRRAVRFVDALGVDRNRVRMSLRGRGPYRRNKEEFARQMGARADGGAAFPITVDYPCLYDRYDQSGVCTGAYFHQDLHVARLILKNGARRHVDVGSRVG